MPRPKKFTNPLTVEVKEDVLLPRRKSDMRLKKASQAAMAVMMELLTSPDANTARRAALDILELESKRRRPTKGGRPNKVVSAAKKLAESLKRE